MKTMRTLITAVLLALCTAVAAMTHLDSRNMLSGGSVYDIQRDSYGLMWMATAGGLDCYNGLSVKTYRAPAQRGQSAMRHVTQTASGHIYAATEHALFTIDRTADGGQMKPVAPTITGTLHALTARGDTLLVGTDHGLFMVHKGKMVRQVWLLGDHLSTGNAVRSIIVQGRQLLLLGNREVYRYDLATGRLTVLGLSRSLAIAGNARTMALSGQTLFIGTYNDGLVAFHLATHRAWRVTGPGSQVITALQVAAGRLYVATDGAGVSVMRLTDLQVEHTFTTANGLLDNSVYSFYRSPEGPCWFGYFRRGLSYEPLSRPLFHYFEQGAFTTRGLNVRSFCIDGERKLIGTREGLHYFDGQQDHYYAPHDLLGGSIVTSVVKYEGMYYLSTFDKGVMRLNPATGAVERFTNDTGVQRASFGRLAVSPQGELWMAGNAGVFVYNARTGSLQHFDHHNSQLYEGYANSLLFDRLGRCWIGTHEGLCIFNPADGTLRSQGFPEGFQSTMAEPNFALGLGRQLLNYSIEGIYETDESLTHYGFSDAANALFPQTVSLLTADERHGRYWVGNEQGLFCCDSTFTTYRKFGAAYGLLDSEFSTAASLIDSDGRLWLGTTGGLVWVTLSDVDKTTFPAARILLDQMAVGGTRASEESDFQMVSQQRLTLGYNWGTGELTFRPTVLNYADQSDMYCEWRVDDGEWHTVRSGERATVNGLPLGRSTLTVRVAGTTLETSYTVWVHPSLLFVLQMVAAVVFAVVIFFYRRNRKELARVREDLNTVRTKYQRVRLDAAESEQLMRRLRAYVETHRSYLQTGLKLSELATALEVSTARLSQVLNVHAGLQFYDFINAYRLEEFKRRLSQGAQSQYTLIALAEECGFRKSSFFATFKRMEGITPTEYVRLKGKASPPAPLQKRGE